MLSKIKKLKLELECLFIKYFHIRLLRQKALKNENEFIARAHEEYEGVSQCVKHSEEYNLLCTDCNELCCIHCVFGNNLIF